MLLHEELIFKIIFRLRERVNSLIIGRLRKLYWCSQGMRIGSNTSVSRLFASWPHQVQIGSRCILEPDVYFKFDGICKPGPKILIGDGTFIGRGCEFNIAKDISVGKNCLIASGAKFIDHDHGLAPEKLMAVQPSTQSSITLEDDIWIGANAIILQGVHIGIGAVVAAGAVVRSSIKPYDIVGGVPARVLRSRLAKSRTDK